MRDAQETAVRTLARWRGDILAFAREGAGVTLDPWQADALVGIQRHPRAAMAACKGPGKTFVLGLAVWWFLCTRTDANIAVTSVSGDNLKDGLWKELALIQSRSPVLLATFEWQSTRIVSRERPATWWASARTWSKSANAQQQADTLAGLHAESMMFVIDEAGAVPLAVGVAADAALASGKECKLAIGGNPTSLDGLLYQAAVTHKQLWHVVTVTGDPDDPKRAPRVDRAWAQQQIDTYGRSNPWVKTNVLGEWPPASLNALLGPEDVRAAMTRQLPAEVYQWSQKRLGVDVARYGDDATVLAPRQGLRAFPMIELRHARGSAVSVEIASRVLAGKATFGSELEFFDATGGWAAGAVDVMRAAGHSPIDVQFAAPAFDPRFKNRRAEIWWGMAEAIKSGQQLPDDAALLGELTSVTYLFNGGRFQIEPKDSVKAKIGRSPDRADALALTFGLPDMPMALTGARGSTGRARTMDNPAGDGQHDIDLADLPPVDAVSFVELMRQGGSGPGTSKTRGGRR